MFLAQLQLQWGKTGGTSPLRKQVYKAERIRIDCRKSLKFSLNLS